MSHPSEIPANGKDALQAIIEHSHQRLTDPGYRAQVDQNLAAMAEDWREAGGGPLTADIARAYLMGSSLMMLQLHGHTIGQHLPCFEEHIIQVWDVAVALLDRETPR